VNWFHSIDLGNGIVTRGAKELGYLKNEESPQLLDPVNLKGASVLDIGAWNGFYSFESKRRGARKVLAADHYVWNNPHFNGREGFDIANEVLGYNIEAIDIDVPDMTPDVLGKHDVVLFLGVLYHLPDPLGGLERAADLALQCMVVETHTDLVHVETPAMAYYPGASLNGDATNFFGPNPACLVSMLRELGFTTIDTIRKESGSRLICHAWRDINRRSLGNAPENRAVIANPSVAGHLAAERFKTTGGISDGNWLILTGTGSLTLIFPADTTAAVFNISNFRNRDLRVLLTSNGASVFDGHLRPGAAKIRIPRLGETAEVRFEVERWVPEDELHNGDKRTIGMHVESISFTRG
jgi:tRNA (mo5U34)-methyltransferase